MTLTYSPQLTFPSLADLTPTLALTPVISSIFVWPNSWLVSDVRSWPSTNLETRHKMVRSIATALAVLLSTSSAPLADAVPNGLGLVTRQSTENCTSSSFTVPSWYIREFKTSSATEASFSLQNRATGSSAALTCKTGASESGWSCTASSSASDPSLHVALQVKCAKASIEVQQSWSCSDRNPSRPYVTP